ncbi:uncharacterized protein YlxW (UPF0749 family) [Desulfitispora alkaliphila]|uniref:DUF881 domain-containing protein n=1 Tax=Desulfitispora alkaliphila TaxID=622674 RepID=UPI003D1B8BB7
MRNNKHWKVPLTITMLILGFFLSVQYKVQQDVENALAMQKTEDLVAMMRNLHEKRNVLEDEISDLLQERRSYLDNVTAEQALVESMEAELKRLQIASGSVPIKGPGISVTITGESHLLYLDLVDIINELWATGAEAIAINDIRVGTNTTIYDQISRDAPEIMVNGRSVLYPVIIYAIGDPHTLEKGLTFPGGIIDNLNTLYNIYPEIRQDKEIILPGKKKATSSR